MSYIQHLMIKKIIASNRDNPQPLTQEQLARSERNRQAALLLRQSKQRLRDLRDKSGDQQPPRQAAIAVAVGFGGVGAAAADSRGGFIYEDDAQDGKDSGGRRQKQQLRRRLIVEPGPLVDPNELVCAECNKPFNSSFLFDRFDVNVCDACYEAQREEAYGLIARSDAKSRYLLKDGDLDRREPALRCLLRRNPHNPRGGDMRLYLEAQVAQRALDVWGSEEALEAELEKRAGARDRAKKRQFDKRMRELRLHVRSSLAPKRQYRHEHQFGEEEPVEGGANEDEFCRTCLDCGYKQTFCKM